MRGARLPVWPRPMRRRRSASEAGARRSIANGNRSLAAAWRRGRSACAPDWRRRRAGKLIDRGSVSALAGPDRQKIEVADDDPEPPRVHQPPPAHAPRIDVSGLLGQHLASGGRPRRDQSFDQQHIAAAETPVAAAADDDRTARRRHTGEHRRGARAERHAESLAAMLVAVEQVTDHAVERVGGLDGDPAVIGQRRVECHAGVGDRPHQAAAPRCRCQIEQRRCGDQLAAPHHFRERMCGGEIAANRANLERTVAAHGGDAAAPPGALGEIQQAGVLVHKGPRLRRRQMRSEAPQVGACPSA